MEKIIEKYLEKELNLKHSGVFSVFENYIFVEDGYFKQVSKIFDITEIKMIDIIYGYFEGKLDYKIFVINPKTFILDLEYIEDEIKLEEEYSELINTLIKYVINLKQEAILKQRYEVAANYRDIEKTLETKKLPIR
jgi:hypothetical protein